MDFNIEYLKKNFTGNKVTIAVIGVDYETVGYNTVTRWKYNNCSELFEQSQVINSVSGDHYNNYCIEQIISISPEANILSINIEPDEIDEDILSHAIYFASTKKADLIVVTAEHYYLPFYSLTIDETCRKASAHSIIIAPGCLDELRFPADNLNVVKIINYNNRSDSIEQLQKNVFKVNCKLTDTYSYTEKNNLLQIEKSLKSDIACAYFAGIMALYIEFQQNIRLYENILNTNELELKDIDTPVITNEIELKNIDTPVILVTGVEIDCEKAVILSEIETQLTENNICIKMLPDYPAATIRDMIYYVNSDIKKIEESTNYERIIIEVEGNMLPVNKKFNTLDGKLYHACINVLPVHYVIICVNSTIYMTSIENEIEKLKMLGIENTAIVVVKSDRFDNKNFDYDEIILEECINEYRLFFSDIPVYSLEEVKNGTLYNDMNVKNQCSDIGSEVT